MIRLGVAAIFCLLIGGCEERSADQIYAAQECLDRATSTTVDTCVSMVAGVTTSKSYVIRCSADFLRQAIDETKIVQAIENLDNNSGSSVVDPNVTLYDFFVFPSLALVDTAVQNCRATNSESLTVLALTAKTATLLKQIAGSSTIAAWIAATDTNTIDGLATSNATQIEGIGETVKAFHPIACAPGGSFKGSEVCDNMGNAIGSGTTSQVAIAFLKQLKTPNN